MGSSKTTHLLSIEDNEDTRIMLKHLLEKNYDITFSASVDEALEAIASDLSFDLLLVDINLGAGKEGTELLHEVRNREDVEEIPAIAVTAYAMPGDEEDLLNEGFDGYVGKPFALAELIEAIEDALAE